MVYRGANRTACRRAIRSGASALDGRHRMAIVLDVLVAGVVAGGVAGGVVLATRPRLARRSGEPPAAGPATHGGSSSSARSANGGSASAPARAAREDEAAADGDGSAGRPATGARRAGGCA